MVIIIILQLILLILIKNFIICINKIFIRLNVVFRIFKSRKKDIAYFSHVLYLIILKFKKYYLFLDFFL